MKNSSLLTKSFEEYQKEFATKNIKFFNLDLNKEDYHLTPKTGCTEEKDYHRLELIEHYSKNWETLLVDFCS